MIQQADWLKKVAMLLKQKNKDNKITYKLWELVNSVIQCCEVGKDCLGESVLELL